MVGVLCQSSPRQGQPQEGPHHLLCYCTCPIAPQGAQGLTVGLVTPTSAGHLPNFSTHSILTGLAPLGREGGREGCLLGQWGL